MAGAGDTETVTRIRPAGVDNFGDPLPGDATELAIPGCMFAPGRSEEAGLGASTVETDGAVYAPPGADVRPTDQLRIRGEVYNVIGKPAAWGSFGVVINVKLVTG